MKTVKIAFSGVWFNPYGDEQQDILKILQETGYSYEVVTTNPDFVIYGPVGKEHLKYECPRIYITGENQSPNFRECDYAVGFDYLEFGDRYFRYPFYRYYIEAMNKATRKSKIVDESLFDRKFCAYVVSNSRGEIRNQFIERIEKKKHIDSGGKYKNNIGGAVKNKIDFLSNYKFSVAMENSSYPGYTTEKILEAFAAGTIPIYWGDPLIANEFNSNAFINISNFETIDEAIDYILYVDSNKEVYLKILAEPVFLKDNAIEKRDELIAFFRSIFSREASEAFRRNLSVTMQEMDMKQYKDSLSLKKRIKEIIRR